jgi:hypothetical protein
MGTGKQRGQYYKPSNIVDAPEFYDLADALGILSSSTWDHTKRSFEERKNDFVLTFPPTDPTRFCGTELEQRGDGLYAPASRGLLMKRFLSSDWRPGSLHELLSRYGLKMANGPLPVERRFEPGAFLETTRRRNHHLRVLHGGVDIEAKDMDAAKVAWLERQERIQAAEQVRLARNRMREEHVALESHREEPEES